MESWRPLRVRSRSSAAQDGRPRRPARSDRYAFTLRRAPSSSQRARLDPIQDWQRLLRLLFGYQIALWILR